MSKDGDWATLIFMKFFHFDIGRLCNWARDFEKEGKWKTDCQSIDPHKPFLAFTFARSFSSVGILSVDTPVGRRHVKRTQSKRDFPLAKELLFGLKFRKVSHKVKSV